MQNPTHSLTLRTMRFLGAVAVLAVGAVHLQQYLGADFRSVPTIGSLFLLNAIGSGVIGAALLMPVERVLTGRRADLAVAALAGAGVVIAVGSLVALFISESGSLFGFSESGYRPAIVIAIIAEAATVILLTPLAVLSVARAPSRGRASTRRSGWAGDRGAA